MIIRPTEYLDEFGMPSDVMIRSVVAEHDREVATRLQQLKDYYDGNSRITHRVRSGGLPNNRLSHPIARYIVNTTSGYLAGEPVSYSTPEDNVTLDALLDAYKRASVSSVDSELARMAAIFGKGVEYLHIDDELMIHMSSMSPINAFVVYDDTHEQKPIFGVYRIPRTNEEGDVIGCNAWVMSDKVIMHIVSSDLTLSSITSREYTEHYFGGIPLIEYWNADDERGDFESVLSLLDAYDKLESDRINDIEQFVDALLVLTGCTMENDEKGRTPAQQLRESKSLSLPDIDAKAEYLTNSLHESDIDILRTALSDDIHKLSMVPDLSDKNFAANSSGVAMRYKLLGLEQITKIKEQWFKEGLRTRLRLVINYLTVRGYPELDVADVDITMSRSLPVNDLENAQVAMQLRTSGSASTETLVKFLHPDWAQVSVDDEVGRIDCESDSRFTKMSELQAAGALSKAELRASVTGEDVDEAEQAIDLIDDSSDAAPEDTLGVSPASMFALNGGAGTIEIPEKDDEE